MFLSYTGEPQNSFETRSPSNLVFYLTMFDFCGVNSCYHAISAMMKPLSQKSNRAVNSLTSDWILQDNLFIPLIADKYYQKHITPKRSCGPLIPFGV